MTETRLATLDVMFNPAKLEAMENYCKKVFETRMLPARNSNEVFGMLMTALDDGTSLTEVNRKYHFIPRRARNDRGEWEDVGVEPTLKSLWVMGAFTAGGGEYHWVERTANRCVCKARAKGGIWTEFQLTFEDAKRMGMVMKPRGGMKIRWQTDSETMLAYRVAVKAVKLLAPHLLMGQVVDVDALDAQPAAVKAVEATVAPGPAVPALGELTDAQREEIRVNEAIERDLEREVHAEEPPKKRRGRRPGSKNKPKPEPEEPIDPQGDPTLTKPEPSLDSGPPISEPDSQPAPEPQGESLVNQLSRKLKELGVPPSEMQAKVEAALGREVKGFADITEEEAGRVLHDLAASEEEA